MSLGVPRRVLTGHDASGRGVVISDGRFGGGLLQTLAPDVRGRLMHDVP